MGHIFSQIFKELFCITTGEVRVGMFGLDNAGKTTILYKLAENLNNKIIVPTIGFNVETIRCGRHLLNIWDVGGGSMKSRILWRHYNEHNTKAVIYVIDATDRQRLYHAASYLECLFKNKELSKAVFLIYANKQDLNNALKAHEIIEILDLEKLAHRHVWVVQECCALTGLGLWHGIRKLMQLYEQQYTITRRPRIKN